VSFFLFLLLPGVVLAGEAKILTLSGNVEARQTREGQWAPASVNLEIPEGGAVRTGADGSAVLYMPNKTKVWLRESSALEVEQRQTLSSRLALMFGKMKIRVPHLMRKEKFEVRTPAAVCAVRGTEFTMEATEDGKMNLQVLFGEVKLKYTVPPEKGKAEFNIVQGQGLNIEEAGKSAKPTLLTAKNEREALENWNPGLQPEERQKDMKEKENDRAQIKDFAKTTNSTESSVKGFLNVVKESDLEAGRTLNDVHGNLVRVDQRMVRPDNSTIQFYNIVKRPDYSAPQYTNAVAASHGFVYNGYATNVPNRLDLLQMNIGFNKDLPQRIEEWPTFFDGNDVKASYMSTIMANRTGSDIFFIATGAKYDAATDDMLNNPLKLLGYNGASDNGEGIIITGVLNDEAGMTAVQGLTKVSRLEIADNTGAGASNGGMVYTDGGVPGVVTVGVNAGDVIWAQRDNVTADNSYSYSSDDANSDQLWNYSAMLYRKGGGNNASSVANNLWYAMESYVIGNGGNIKTTGDFTNSSSDPFSILKDSGGEIIMSVKNWSASGTAGNSYSYIDNSATGDYFASTKNIDIVFIPDLFVAAVQRMLPALSKIGE